MGRNTKRSKRLCESHLYTLVFLGFVQSLNICDFERIRGKEEKKVRTIHTKVRKVEIAIYVFRNR